MPTRHRTFRIPDDIYDPAQQRAEREGTTVTAVVQECLRQYEQGGEGQAPYQRGYEQARSDMATELTLRGQEALVGLIKELLTPRSS